MKEIIFYPFPNCLKCSDAKFAFLNISQKLAEWWEYLQFPSYHLTKIFKLSKTLFCELKVIVFIKETLFDVHFQIVWSVLKPISHFCKMSQKHYAIFPSIFRIYLDQIVVYNVIYPLILTRLDIRPDSCIQPAKKSNKQPLLETSKFQLYRGYFKTLSCLNTTWIVLVIVEHVHARAYIIFEVK